ncbi:dihydropteroate synthase [Helicobacter cinaedi]|uniref:dihydropteroate synthase n=1 Tax=Helicobacter cinaedi TaxID=213 RepID=UPI001EED5514|nr:dihydropteroate synthase [Helicobacter cinaedi]
MRVQKINTHAIPQAIKQIGADRIGQKIMSKKSQILGFEIKDLSFEALNILKQEALSIGGDCATPRGCIKHQGEKKAILIVTPSQLEKLIHKLAYQPFGLKDLRLKLKTHLEFVSKDSNKQDSKIRSMIMAIVNVTPDSFYASSRKDTQGAKDRIHALLAKEVGIIDIGGASSRPGSELIDSQSEIMRLKPIIEYIHTNKLYEKAEFSIDTYNPKTADYALSKGFTIINDISGFADEEMFKVAQKHKAKVILMHSKGTPKTMQNLTQYDDIFAETDSFFAEKIEKCKAYNIQNIILDIGFGFAKTTQQNLALIKHLSHFLHFGFPLLVGASRKNTIGEITGRETQDRLAGSLALHLCALQNGASILRMHDEDSHIDMVKIYKALYE